VPPNSIPLTPHDPKDPTLLQTWSESQIETMIGNRIIAYLRACRLVVVFNIEDAYEGRANNLEIEVQLRNPAGTMILSDTDSIILYKEK
jgi:hypothetical protein